MAGKPWEKYQTAPVQPEAVPATPAAGKPWEKYAQPATAPVEASPEPPRDPLIMQGLGKFTEGIAGLPGVPLDLMAAGGNFIRRQLDLPETQLKDTWAKDWGSEGWSDAAFKAAGMPKVAAPTNDTERLVQKGGLFFGGAVPFGPAALLPTATAFAGSEAGRVADEVAPEYTKGYGETVGTLAGGVAGSGRRAPVRAPAPTTEQLRAQARNAYDTADQAGVIYTPAAMQRLGSTVDSDLAQVAYHPDMQPKIKPVLNYLAERAQSNVTLKDVDTLRKLAGNAAKSVDPAERMMASKIIEKIDEFVDAPQQGDVLTGDAKGAAAALKNARETYKRMAKSEKIEAALENADTQAASTYSGGNIDNATRQKLKPMLMRGSKASRGWTADEKALLRKVNKGGGVGQQLLRQVGKLSPEAGFGKYLMAGFGAGSLANPAVLPMFGLSAAGFASKRIADAMTRSNVEELLETVRRGGQAYQPRTPRRMLTRASAAVPGATQER